MKHSPGFRPPTGNRPVYKVFRQARVLNPMPYITLRFGARLARQPVVDNAWKDEVNMCRSQIGGATAGRLFGIAARDESRVCNAWCHVPTRVRS